MYWKLQCYKLVAKHADGDWREFENSKQLGILNIQTFGNQTDPRLLGKVTPEGDDRAFAAAEASRGASEGSDQAEGLFMEATIREWRRDGRESTPHWCYVTYVILMCVYIFQRCGAIVLVPILLGVCRNHDRMVWIRSVTEYSFRKEPVAGTIASLQNHA